MNHQLTKTSICVTLTNHQLTWTSICVTETIRWWTINLRGQVFVLHRQYVDESSTYVDKYLCYRDNTLMNHQLTSTSICATKTIRWWTINLRGQVVVLQRQYVDVPSPYVDKYLCYRDNTLMNHQRTWTSICVTETIRWWTINLRGQVFVLQRQHVDESSTYVDKYLCNFDEPSTYVDKYLCYRDNTLTNHQLMWASSCVTETILWRTINLRGRVVLLQWQYFDEPSTYVDK
jgi:RNA-binding protein YhbY